ncbi:hypothetical protein CQW23_17331 [Capsicum baccatum]|uniref:Leucine-rich repeat-containing N-terminal plant-type domain-containing protein n=1 Tax=Capsicum baccatum TaxID=33114 RepID=A0A2G2WDF8_CAPBA|nr:hypothetical protein CQW23_17331 [Capsicum baccatum]
MIIAEKFIQHIVVFDIFLTIFISSSEVGDGKIKCVAIEKEALLRLKEEFLDIHGRLSSCGNEAYNEDCCRWRGVQCDNQTGNVIRLGPHPVTVHIFLLSHCKLRYLAMGHVHLPNATDWLQSVLKLSFLQVLILPGCKLSLPIPSVAPSSNLLMSLTTLDFSSNNLNNSIYTWLYNFSSLCWVMGLFPSYVDKMDLFRWAPGLAISSPCSSGGLLDVQFLYSFFRRAPGLTISSPCSSGGLLDFLFLYLVLQAGSWTYNFFTLFFKRVLALTISSPCSSGGLLNFLFLHPVLQEGSWTYNFFTLFFGGLLDFLFLYLVLQAGSWTYNFFTLFFRRAPGLTISSPCSSGGLLNFLILHPVL